ncbi:MAG: hypothetical protein HDR15_07310 [Lachnospiraceae bacterium]|nr:hypothetical protein [Lachnospiraceae bacterium]
MKAFWSVMKKSWGEHVVFLLACLLCLGVYPLGLIGHSEYVSESVDEQVYPYIGVENGNSLSGSFIPAHRQLESIGIRFSTQNRNIVDGTLLFALYDSEEEQIARQRIDCTEIKNNEYFEFEVNAELSLTEEYHFVLATYGSSDGVPCVFGGSDAIGPEEVGEFSLMDETEVTKRIPIRLRYTGRTAGKTVLVYDISILFVAMLLLFGIRRKEEGAQLLSFGGVYRFLCFLTIGIMLILVADESAKPLRMNGSELRHDIGAAEWDYLVIGEGSGYCGAWASMDTYVLDEGSYYIGAAYTAETGTNKLVVTDNGKIIVEELLSEDENYVEIPFTLDHDSQEIRIEYWYGGVGYFLANSLSLHADTVFYRDAGYYAIVFSVISLAFAGYALYQKRRLIQMPEEAAAAKRKRAVSVVLMAVALFSFLPYLHGSLPWGDDLCYHLIRIEGIKDGMRDGQFPVFVYPEGLKGYGYLNCMYPYLFLYIPAVIRLFGVSIAASYKTLIFLFAVLTAFITYHSVRSMYPSTKAALMAAILYTCCPYRYTNVYARGAVGEALAMTFLPLLIAGLYHVLAGRRKKWWMLALGMTGLFQTHILSVTFGGMLCVIGGMLFLSRVWKERRFLEIGKAALMTVLLNLWFLLPFLSYYSKGDLWTSTLDYSTYSEWSIRLSGIAGVNTAGNYRSLALGLPVVLCAGIAAFWLLTRQRAASPEQEEIPGEFVRYLQFLTLAGFVCLFLLSGQFGAWEFMRLSIFESLFSTIQFPWRLLGLSSAFFIIAGSIALFDCARLSRCARSMAIVLCAICLLSATRYQEEDFAYEDYTAVYTEGHESKIIGVPKGVNTIVYPYEWRREGLTDAVLIPDAIRISDANEVTIESYRRKGTTTTVSYTASSKKAWIVLPVQCYDGYRAEDELGRTVAIEPNEDQLVSFTTIGDGERHTVTLSFHQKPIFVLATVISILAAAGYVCWFSLRPCLLRAGGKKRGALRKDVGGEQDADGI